MLSTNGKLETTYLLSGRSKSYREINITSLQSFSERYFLFRDTSTKKTLLTRSLYWRAAQSGNTFFPSPDSFYSCASNWGHIDLSVLVPCHHGIMDVRGLNKYLVTTPSCHLNKVEFISAFWIMKLAGTVLFEPCWRSQIELTVMGMTDETSSRTEMAFLIFSFIFLHEKKRCSPAVWK